MDASPLVLFTSLLQAVEYGVQDDYTDDQFDDIFNSLLQQMDLLVAE
jgi:hypothetical protein